MQATCAGCGVTFEARTRRAKWHSDRCRKAAAKKAKESSGESGATDANPEPGLVASIRRELQAAGVLESYPAQLALELARRLSTPQESGISSLSKELRTVMASALEGRTPPTAEAEPEDEV